MDWRIKLHRSSTNNELYFSEKFNKRHAWQDLVLHCNHKKRTIFIRWVEINLKRWQIWWSEITMCWRWTRSRDKVRRFLKWLETRQQIIQQKTTVTTIITIINYEKYQQDDTTNNTTEKQQKNIKQDINKNDKNDNKYIKRENFKKFHNEYKEKWENKKPLTKEMMECISFWYDLGRMFEWEYKDITKLTERFINLINNYIWRNDMWNLMLWEFKRQTFNWYSYHTGEKTKIKNFKNSMRTWFNNYLSYKNKK